MQWKDLKKRSVYFWLETFLRKILSSLAIVASKDKFENMLRNWRAVENNVVDDRKKGYQLDSVQNIVVEVCGGNLIDFETLAMYEKQFLAI